MYHRFKLFLAADHDNCGLAVLPPDLSPEKIISDFLRFIKESALAKLDEQWGPGMALAEGVIWALTIPANWPDTAKETMRQAAVTAGLISHADST